MLPIRHRPRTGPRSRLIHRRPRYKVIPRPLPIQVRFIPSPLEPLHKRIPRARRIHEHIDRRVILRDRRRIDHMDLLLELRETGFHRLQRYSVAPFLDLIRPALPVQRGQLNRIPIRIIPPMKPQNPLLLIHALRHPRHALIPNFRRPGPQDIVQLFRHAPHVNRAPLLLRPRHQLLRMPRLNPQRLGHVHHLAGTGKEIPRRIPDHPGPILKLLHRPRIPLDRRKRDNQPACPRGDTRLQHVHQVNRHQFIAPHNVALAAFRLLDILLIRPEVA